MNPATFPRPVGTFIGRRREIARVLGFIEREVLFLIYGPGGIGKTEFVYKVIDELHDREPWASLPRVLLPIEERGAYLLALLRKELAVGGGPAPQEERAALEEIVRVLDARPALLVLDDLHQVDPEAGAAVVSYLARRVRKSRLFVTSRVALPLDQDPALAVTLQLGALDPQETAAMVQTLAQRLGREAPSVDEIYQRSGGSPFLIQRAVHHFDQGAVALAGSLERTLAELSPDARRQLLLLAIAQQRAPPQLDSAVLQDLLRRFLVDQCGGRLRVHDFVRSSLLRVATAEEITAARRQAAALLLRSGEEDQAEALLNTLDAVQHLCAAGDWEETWQLIQRSHEGIAAADLDQLLLAPLERLAPELPAAAFEITVLLASIHCRASRIAVARGLLRTQEGTDAARRSMAFHRLLGWVAQREGDLDVAESHYGAAQALCVDPRDCANLNVQRANLRSLSGRGAEARALLRAVPPQESGGERARYAWALAFSFLNDDQHAQAAAVVASALLALPAMHKGRARTLTMLQVFALVEHDDVSTAVSLADELQALRTQARGQHAEFLRITIAVARGAAGAFTDARAALEEGLGYLLRHGDHSLAAITGYYLTEVLLELGDLPAAGRALAQASQAARRSSLSWVLWFQAPQRARLLLMQGRISEARQVVDEATRDPRQPWRARRLCLATGVWCGLTQEDLVAARAYARAAPLHQSPAERSDLDALFLLLRGEVEVAYTVASDSERRCRSRGRRWHHYGIVATLVLCALARSEPEPRQRALRALRHVEESSQTPATTLRVLMLRAMLGEVPARAPCPAEAEAAVLEARLMALEGVSARFARLMACLRTVSGSPLIQVLDQGKLREVDGLELGELRAARALFVDLPRQVLTVRGGGELAGKALLCRLLARLAREPGCGVSAEVLYNEVWGRAVYHPLRHRGTVYVAVNRLRRALRDLGLQGEVVQSAGGCWSLAPSVEICVLLSATESAAPLAAAQSSSTSDPPG